MQCLRPVCSKIARQKSHSTASTSSTSGALQRSQAPSTNLCPLLHLQSSALPSCSLLWPVLLGVLPQPLLTSRSRLVECSHRSSRFHFRWTVPFLKKRPSKYSDSKYEPSPGAAFCSTTRGTQRITNRMALFEWLTVQHAENTVKVRVKPPRFAATPKGIEAAPFES